MISKQNTIHFFVVFKVAEHVLIENNGVLPCKGSGFSKNKVNIIKNCNTLKRNKNDAFAYRRA